MPIQQLPDNPVPGAIIVKLYRYGDEVRGYVRQVTDPSEEDIIFPGEEMEPDAAFRLARAHSRGETPIYVELVEDVQWDPGWGTLIS
ncbi:hypothetical protein AU381_20025 [Sinorhizobium glycinis]|uniref:Uncharacterized protein n=1 Tax=Sinorhizobium glycinis TaxID=1472378 RepID=A0A178XNJ4_9HYPH|nr:hypothetical protein [Sinorhizobium glycinis]OAP36764.1 hypothetical protein AU381_20025 [Sinorhizobium glycinis]